MSGFARYFVFAFKVPQKSNKAETCFILIVYTTESANTDSIFFIHLKRAP